MTKPNDDGALNTDRGFCLKYREYLYSIFVECAVWITKNGTFLKFAMRFNLDHIRFSKTIARWLFTVGILRLSPTVNREKTKVCWKAM